MSHGVGDTPVYGPPNAPVHDRAERRCFHVQSKHLLSISLYANPVFQLNTNTREAEKTTHFCRNTTSETNDAKVFPTTEHRDFSPRQYRQTHHFDAEKGGRVLFSRGKQGAGGP